MHTSELRQIVSLAGSWRFALDGDNVGIRDAWFSTTLAGTISLPGTTDQARTGEFVDERCDDRLSRVWRWVGPAWYQQTVEVPERWEGRIISLFLERTKDSQVWVDDTWVGSDASLSTPHRFDLSRLLTPGAHRLTILIDNAKLPPVGPCHQVDERTQTNWNGIVGRIELQITDPIRVDDVQVYPHAAGRSLRVVSVIRNVTDQPSAVVVKARATLVGRSGRVVSSIRSFPRLDPGTTTAESELVLSDFPLWDEFDRSLICLTVEARTSDGSLRDSVSVTCGLRDFVTVGNRFVLNGRRIFLRGKNDGALFPLTGYAPMEKAEWLRLLGIASEWGINHYRFHSWCPPEAAFDAADELGIYFQVELPNKRPIVAPGDPDRVPPAGAYETLEELAGPGGDTADRTTYLIAEGERILAEYGNHPSFVMMTLGNELSGDEAVMKSMCDHFRAIDPRHLYSLGTHHHNDDPHLTDGDDFWVTAETGPGRPVRGASFHGRSPCHVDNVPPSTLVDYRESLADIPIPVIGHEMAQYEVFPDFSEIPKYTGVTRARNLEIFRDRLEAAGMLDQAADFVRASGALSAILHREDVEAALRTPGFGGFQMLDLQDFSGQGTALVGMLNVFMESKGLISPEEWRRFCSPTVPLLGMPKYTWTTDEVFTATLRLAHYGPDDLADATISWALTDGEAEIARGTTQPFTAPTGDVSEFGSISVALDAVDPPRKLRVSLELDGTLYRNDYDIWVYPPRVEVTKVAAVHESGARSAVIVARVFDEAVTSALHDGARVLLIPEPDSVQQSVGGAFQTSFWCWPMFRRVAIKAGIEVAPGTLGFLCDPAHPLLSGFPTEFHSNWQWWRMAKASRPLILDSTPVSYRPVIQVIDNFARNHKLGLVCEARVGKGKLVICSIDLPALTDYPEARQLMHSMVHAMEGDAFDPQAELGPALIASIV